MPDHAWPALLRPLRDRDPAPRPWRDGHKIPWHEPAFSRRVLDVHLDPGTHMASRGPDVIAEHVSWLLELLSAEPEPEGRPRHLLDLGCGPGLYALPLARAGLRVTGIDVGPAAVAHARQTARDAGPGSIEIIEGDVTELPDLDPVDVATCWFGEFNSFPPADARRILDHLARAVRPDGLLVLEYQPADLFARDRSTSWLVHERSVFLDTPHLWLEQHVWDEELQAEIIEFWIVDPIGGETRRYTQCHQAYADEVLRQMLAMAGFVDARCHPPITGVDERLEFPLVVARRAS
jgi:SAM-dependent methyltransferase